MNALVCDICDARVPWFSGKGWREVKRINSGLPEFGISNQPEHICTDCWTSMVALRQDELS